MEIRIDGEYISLLASVTVPEMEEMSTRVLQEHADVSQLHLYLLEFEDLGSSADNAFLQMYEAEKEETAGDIVKYRLTFTNTSFPRILHLVALPGGESLNVDEAGVEASIIPQLTTSAGTEAYWRRVSFPQGYSSLKADGSWEAASYLKEKLGNVELIRNFAKISVTNEDPEFTFLGFTVINRPDRGTVAPWDMKKLRSPEFLKADGTPKSYRELREEYEGYTPAGTSLTWQAGESDVPAMEGVEPKYIYERPFINENRTYIVIKGRVRNSTVDSYYKLDLGRNDESGYFRYFALYRNFNYNVRLKEVAAAGYKSMQEAVGGVVYNNLYFDVDLQPLLNMSNNDNKEIVYVNFTTAVLTDTETEEKLKFKYRYKNVSGSGPAYNNDDVNFVDLVPGPVIKSVSIGKTDDSEGWRTVTITCNKATSQVKTQSFSIVKASGLGRTINLILRKKWSFSNVKEYQGFKINWSSSTANEGVAAATGAANLTVFFDIPDNLPKAIFPLAFVLESNRQDVENAQEVGDMSVSYGTSLFGEDRGVRIQYLKEVTWDMYNAKLEGDSGSAINYGTVIEKADGTKIHRIHCRMETIYSLSSHDITAAVTTTVRIYNPYFNMGSAKFTRTP